MSGHERMPVAFDRMTRGEADYASVTLLLDERLRAANDARRATDDDHRQPSLRVRAGTALVAFGIRVGGRGPERSAAEARSATLPRPARAGRAG